MLTGLFILSKIGVITNAKINQDEIMSKRIIVLTTYECYKGNYGPYAKERYLKIPIYGNSADDFNLPLNSLVAASILETDKDGESDKESHLKLLSICRITM